MKIFKYILLVLCGFVPGCLMVVYNYGMSNGKKYLQCQWQENDLDLSNLDCITMSLKITTKHRGFVSLIGYDQKNKKLKDVRNMQEKIYEYSTYEIRDVLIPKNSFVIILVTQVAIPLDLCDMIGSIQEKIVNGESEEELFETLVYFELYGLGHTWVYIKALTYNEVITKLNK